MISKYHIIVQLFCVTIFNLQVFSNAARILAVFPIPSISHQVVFRPLTHELARRGHELVILTSDPAFQKGQAPENITEIDFHDMSYGLWREAVVNQVDGDKYDSFAMASIGFKLVSVIFDKVLELPELQSLTKGNQTFDLILAEAAVNLPIAYSYVFKAPVIQISSLAAFSINHHVIGTPQHPVIYPDLLHNRFHNMSIWEKMYAIYADIRFRHIMWKYREFEDSIVTKHFGADVPSLSELFNNVDMLFLNIDPIWEGNRASPPGVIHLGGLHQKPEKELPQDLKNYLDNSKHGVIYISFGTNVNPSLLPPDRIQMLANVFSKLPYDVIWKFDSEKLPGKPKNVKLYKWLPQSDLLRHPKIKLFVTQGGLQSTDEAITAGVPLIAFPMLGDQWYNAEKYVHHGIGMKHDLATITEEDFMKSILEVIENKSYRNNIGKLRSYMRDRPQKPLERAVWWTEYVIRHGGAKHLRSPTANISWTEYLMLDVVAVVLGSLVVASAVIVKLLIFVYDNYVLYGIKFKSD